MHAFICMARTKKTEKRVTANLSEESFRLLEELAVEQDRSLSWLVNQAIDLYLKSQGKKKKWKANNPEHGYFDAWRAERANGAY